MLETTRIDLPKKKAAANPGRLETEDMPSAAPRKRKTGRTAGGGPSAHEAGRHPQPTPTAKGGQGRRSDRKFIRPTNLRVALRLTKHCSRAYPVNCAGAPTPKTLTNLVARAPAGVYGHPPFPQIQHV